MSLNGDTLDKSNFEISDKQELKHKNARACERNSIANVLRLKGATFSNVLTSKIRRAEKGCKSKRVKPRATR